VRNPDRGSGGDWADQPAGRHEPVRHQCAAATRADPHGVPRRAAVHGGRLRAARDPHRLSDHLALAAESDAVSASTSDLVLAPTTIPDALPWNISQWRRRPTIDVPSLSIELPPSAR